MWWWFRRQKQKLRVLEGDVQESFSKVHRDTEVLFQWVDYLHKANTSQQHTIKTLSLQNINLHKRVEELSNCYAEHKNHISDLHSQVQKEVPEHKIRAVVEEPLSNLHTRISEVEQKLSGLQKPQTVQRSALQDQVLRRVARKSKEYVKNTIRSLILKYGRISALQLRDIVVDEQNVCSRSSFYRLLEEVENEDGVVMQVKGKEKEYLARIPSTEKY